MAIGELCSREVIVIYSKDSVADAARLMREHHVGSLVVIEREDGAEGGPRPVGMFTDRDVAVGVVALGLDPEKTLVEAVMRPGVAVLRESDGVGRAVALMRDQGVRRLPVTDASGRLVGLLAADDLLDLLAGEMSDLAVTASRGIGRETRERAAVL